MVGPRFKLFRRKKTVGDFPKEEGKRSLLAPPSERFLPNAYGKKVGGSSSEEENEVDDDGVNELPVIRGGKGAVIARREEAPEEDVTFERARLLGKVKSVVLRSTDRDDLTDVDQAVDTRNASKFANPHQEPNLEDAELSASGKETAKDEEGGTTVDPIEIIRKNLPMDPLLNTPFGTRRMTYADYTASGRSLHFLETYMKRVIVPMYANTHTETSATGLQTTHSREEARSIIMKSLHADSETHALIFTGTGVTGALWKLIAILGIHCPKQLLPFLDMTQVKRRPLVLVSQAEHHSNELMWRETIADVLAMPPDSTGSLDLKFLDQTLRERANKYDLIIGSFTAGSNVTGLTTKPGPVATVLHKYGAYVCFDYAGAGPYREMCMSQNTNGEPLSYLDAIVVSPHKFVGGPGTPGLLCVRKDFADCRNASSLPPTIAGGGTVRNVWPEEESATSNTLTEYETTLTLREEAGTPGVMESIRCGLVFHVRNLIGPQKIEQIEGIYASNAVKRLQDSGVWVMGDAYSNIKSKERLSITSFNIFCKLPNKQTGQMETFISPQTGHPMLLHYHFVAALLNDLYGIQARSGCACAGPLAFRLFNAKWPFFISDGFSEKQRELNSQEVFFLRPGFCRVNFNYFIDQEEFDYIIAAIEQIAEHGWKLLPLYALCIKSGQYWFNGLVKDETTEKFVNFNRFDAVRTLEEMQFQTDGSVTWNESRTSKASRSEYLKSAMDVYEDAPKLIRRMLFRFRDQRCRNVPFPADCEKYRFFILGSEVLPYLGISEAERQREAMSAQAQCEKKNPKVAAFPITHPIANPKFTAGPPRGS